MDGIPKRRVFAFKGEPVRRVEQLPYTLVGVFIRKSA